MNPSMTDKESSVKTRAWKRMRVFISSTFEDMHGERDLIHRYIFPELKRRCRGLAVDAIPVDLRWGIKTDVHQLRACLDEIDACNVFVGIVGGEENSDEAPKRRSRSRL